MRINGSTFGNRYYPQITGEGPRKNSKNRISLDALVSDASAARSPSSLVASLTRSDVSQRANMKLLLKANQSSSTKSTQSTIVHTLPGASKLPAYEQTGNGCGSTTTAMIVTALTGKAVTQADVDRDVRRFNVFTPPIDLIDYAREQGVNANGYNDGTWDEVASMLDRGCPVQALIKSDGQTNRGVDGPHYVVITKYDPTVAGGRVTFRDPNNWTQTVTCRQFDEMWRGLGFGFDRYFNAYAPKGTVLPPGRLGDATGSIYTLEGAANVMNGVHRMGTENPVRGALQVGGGLVQSIGGVIDFGLSQGARWVDEKVEEIPVLPQLLQPITGVVRTVGGIIGHLTNGVGEGASKLGAAFSKLTKGDVGGFFKNVAQGVESVVECAGKAVFSAIKGIGNAIGKLFGGW